MTASHLLNRGYWGPLLSLLIAAALPLTACMRAAAVKPVAAAAKDPCVEFAAVLAGAATTQCAPVQHLCLVVRDVTQALGQADFLPDSSFGERWRPHVAKWRTELDAVGSNPALEPFVLVVRTKLDILEGMEKDRRLLVKNRDLQEALALLLNQVPDALPGQALSCTAGR